MGPSLLWVVLTWAALIVVVIFAAVRLLNFGAPEQEPPPAAEWAPTTMFTSGRPATLTLDPKERPVIYAATTGEVRFTCEATDASGGGVALTRPGYAASVRADGRLWEHVFDIGVKAPGRYTISCDILSGPAIEFGIGKMYVAPVNEPVGIGDFLIELGKWLVITLLLLVLAIVATAVVLVRRSRAKRGDGYRTGRRGEGQADDRAKDEDEGAEPDPGGWRRYGPGRR